MNALETLTAVTGCEPNEMQSVDALAYGGLDDAQTIASIPEQFRVWGLALWHSRGLLPPPAVVAWYIDLRSWDHTKGWRDRADRMANGWREREHLHANPIIRVYLKYLGRVPISAEDQAGLRYWTGELQHKSLSEVTRDFVATAHANGEAVQE